MYVALFYALSRQLKKGVKRKADTTTPSGLVARASPYDTPSSFDPPAVAKPVPAKSGPSSAQLSTGGGSNGLPKSSSTTPLAAVKKPKKEVSSPDDTKPSKMMTAGAGAMIGSGGATATLGGGLLGSASGIEDPLEFCKEILKDLFSKKHEVIDCIYIMSVF